MNITELSIRNFKSIRCLTMHNMEQALILVGKNSTGKTVVLDAILAVTGNYEIQDSDFAPEGQNIEISMTLDIPEEELPTLWQRGIVSKYKRYEVWHRDFCAKLPSYQEGRLSFTFVAGRDGRVRYEDGVKKNNACIPALLPKVYYIDHSRKIEEIQRDIFNIQGGQELKALRENRCMFDRAKACDNCFDCMGVIEKKTPAQLSIQEAEKLLDYKLFHLNMDSFMEKLNQYFRENSSRPGELLLHKDMRVSEAFSMNTVLYNPEQKRVFSMDQLSEGMRSMYLLSLLEAYAQEPTSLPSIILMEDPEIFLHPKMQKTAGEVLYRLSRKNQIIFCTHSPTMIFNFNSRQIKQIRLDEDGYTVADENPDIDEVLDNLGYSANDLMNVSFVFIVEGKQDSSRLPLLLEKYYAEIYTGDDKLRRIAIIPTNSCTNIRTYANLKYINKLYLKDQFLMIRDSDGKDREGLVRQLCGYYKDRERQDRGNLPRVQPRNVLVLKYYSFENYFLDPKVMAKIGVVKSEEDFYRILYGKFREYLNKLTSVKHMEKVTGVRIRSEADVKAHMEEICTYVRGHNLYDIFYGRYKGAKEEEILRQYIDEAPRETFADILEAIDQFVYFENRKQ